MNRTALATLASGIVLAGIVLAGGTPPAAAQKSFGDTTDVVVVEIPVTVTTEDGEPIRNLTADDFEVRDGRKKQRIVGFEMVDLSTMPGQREAALRQPIPAAARRHFLLLFDVTFSDPTALVRARQAARDLVRDGLHPEDLAAVAVYSVQRGPVLILGFTPDRAQLELALDTLGDPSLIDRVNDPLRLVFADPGSTAASLAAGVSRQAQTERDAAVQEYLGSLGTLLSDADRQVMEDQIRSMGRQLSDLARLMDSVEGRKYVVLLSEGFDDKLLVGRGAGLASGPRRSGVGSVDITDTASTDNPAADAIASGDIASVRSEDLYGSGQVQNDVQQMLQEFVKSDCIIQAVDIGGLRAGASVRPEGSGQNALSMMASETGGEVFRHFNDLSEAMDRMLRKTSVTYLLAIQPEDLELDGKFHRLKVKVDGLPRSTEVRHRPGYYAPLPLKEQNALERQLRAADRLLGESGGQIETAVLATPFKTGSEQAYVPLLIEVGGESLTLGSSGGVLPVEIYAYALDERGGVHDFFTHSLGVDLDQAPAVLHETGLKYYGHLDLEPGEYTVRVLVRNLETGLSSLEVVPVAVPDFAGSSPVASPPLFPEPLGKWLLVREGEDRQRNVPFPFMLKEGPYLPSARPVVGKSGQAQLPLVVYNLSDGPVEVKARVVGADGEERKGCEVVGTERFLTSLPGAQTLLVTVEHSGLSPGEYTLEVRVTDPDSGEETVTSTPLVVAAKA